MHGNIKQQQQKKNPPHLSIQSDTFTNFFWAETKANNNGLKRHPRLCGPCKSPPAPARLSRLQVHREQVQETQLDQETKYWVEGKFNKQGPDGCAEVGITSQHPVQPHERGLFTARPEMTDC